MLRFNLIANTDKFNKIFLAINCFLFAFPFIYANHLQNLHVLKPLKNIQIFLNSSFTMIRYKKFELFFKDLLIFILVTFIKSLINDKSTLMKLMLLHTCKMNLSFTYNFKYQLVNLPIKINKVKWIV